MTNFNYRRGRAKEYRVKKKWEKAGYTVLRTAGSHGFADLIAIGKVSKTIFFIQCKPKKFLDSQTKKLEVENNWINDEFICEFKVE